jgi:mRNA interferase RelE/StbE
VKIVIQEEFVQDLEKLNDKKLRKRVEKAVEQLAAAKSLHGISQIKQLRAASHAFRYRIGDYRLGFFLIDGSIHLKCFLHRRGIYRDFP